MVQVGDEFRRLDPEGFCGESSGQHMALLIPVPIAGSDSIAERTFFTVSLPANSIEPRAAD